MQHPKVVVIGVGSLFFGRQAIWQMTHSPILNGGTLAMTDIEPSHLSRMHTLARKVVEHTGVKLAIEADTDRRKVLKDADFVVLSFAKDSVKYRGIDCRIALEHGIRMCSGDTIGPGGIMRTLREFPQILNCCRDIEQLCPNAWVINYINPTAANGIGLKIFAPKLKSFALCDGLHMPHVKRFFAIRAGIIPDAAAFTPEVDAKFDFRITGPNHFTWLMRANYEGRDYRHALAECLHREAATETNGGDTGAKAIFNALIGWELYNAFGYVPTCVAHTKEYVRFWQGLGKNSESAPPLSIWETHDRYERHAQMWRDVDEYNYGHKTIAEFMTKTGTDHATDIIEAMWSNSRKPFFVNTANGRTVPNMPADAFLEMLCEMSMEGPRPLDIGDAPVGLRGLWQQVLDTHELTARAAATCDRKMLSQAFCCDPLTLGLADSRAMMEKLLIAEREVLPEGWFR